MSTAMIVAAICAGVGMLLAPIWLFAFFGMSQNSSALEKRLCMAVAVTWAVLIFGGAFAFLVSWIAFGNRG